MKINFLNIPVDAITMDETVAIIDHAIKEDQHLNHVVINASKVVAMQKNPELYKSVVSCDIINADGQSIVWAARFLKKEIPERVAGIDLMLRLLELSDIQGYKCFFLGAKEVVITKLVDRVAEKYGQDIIAGYRNGYYAKEEEMNIARQISESGAHILFVAISSPRKENFLFNNRSFLKKVNFTMGVGGSFDVVAGITKRAPYWMQKTGLEWFYRFIQEPKRMWRRYLVGNLSFLWLILKEKFKNKK